MITSLAMTVDLSTKVKMDFPEVHGLGEYTVFTTLMYR